MNLKGRRHRGPVEETQNIELGMRGMDRITRFTGVLTARASYLAGSTQWRLTAEALVEGKPVEEWFDEARIELV